MCVYLYCVWVSFILLCLLHFSCVRRSSRRRRRDLRSSHELTKLADADGWSCGCCWASRVTKRWYLFHLHINAPFPFEETNLDFLKGLSRVSVESVDWSFAVRLITKIKNREYKTPVLAKLQQCPISKRNNFEMLKVCICLVCGCVCIYACVSDGL